jgi:endonuclease-3
LTDWDKELTEIRNAIRQFELPSVNIIETGSNSPWAVLVSTIISLRTKDKVTLEASRRLLNKAPDPFKLLTMTPGSIAALIYPAGFYNVKAENLLKIADILVKDHSGKVPDSADKLKKLPGVGLKSANLILGLAFGIPAICVDTHVHRIANRKGWVKTKTPEETEKELTKILPEKWWIEINTILVSFGSNICLPVSPKCSECPLSSNCPKTEVSRHR